MISKNARCCDKMKILLIEPPYLLPNDWKGLHGITPPLGLLYIAAIAEKEGNEVKIVDTLLNKWKQVNTLDDVEYKGKKVRYLGMSYDEIKELIEKEKPDMVGVGVWSIQRFSAFKTFEVVKQIDPNIITVMGGIHATVRPYEGLNNEDIDFVVLAEGEITFTELLKELKNENPDFSKIKGLGYKQDGKAHLNEMRKPIEDLDSLPFPAWHKIDLMEYDEVARSFQGPRQSTKRTAVVFTSRGCPFDCVFCASKIITGRRWRPRDPKKVVVEIERLIKEFGIEEIDFEDDNMTLLPERIIEFCDLIIEKGLKFTWGTGNAIRADTITKELLVKMKEAGCIDVTISPETGDQSISDYVIGKRLDLKKVENAVKMCKEINLPISCNFVIGMTGEKIENIEKTLEFAKKLRELGAYKSHLSIAFPFYGTRLYNLSKEKGYLLKDDFELELALLNKEAVIKTPDFDPELLYKIHGNWMRKTELEMIKRIIRRNPLSAAKLFLSRPTYVTKYLVNNFIIKPLKKK